MQSLRPSVFGVRSLLLLSVVVLSIATLSACKGKHSSIRTPSAELAEQSVVSAETERTEAKTPVESPSDTSVQDSRWLILPGKRVGGITGNSSLADLQTLFGKANVKPDQVPGAEGTRLDGAWIYPNDPHKKLMIIWKEGATPKTVESVSLTGDKSLWHTADGVHLGTSLKELERLNDGAFTLAGFDWDYGGSVLSWGDHGRLRAKYQQNGALMVRLTYPEKAPEAEVKKVMGDQTFSSANPAMQAVNPIVNSIWVAVQ